MDVPPTLEKLQALQDTGLYTGISIQGLIRLWHKHHHTAYNVRLPAPLLLPLTS
jgi:hypothetical protein